MGNNNTLDINEILRLIPHRYPFVFIDKIIEHGRPAENKSSFITG